MSQPKSKTVLFVAVILQTTVAAAILVLALPYYFWGPVPADEAALQTYAQNAQAVLSMVVALWAVVVCVAYYTCIMRPRRPGAGGR